MSNMKSVKNLIAARQSSMKLERSSDLSSEISRVLASSLADSTFIFSLAVSAFVIFTHIDDIDSGPLGPFLRNHQDSAVAKWVLENIDKFFGVVSFLPACLRVPKSLRTTVFVSAFLSILILPPLHIYSYTVAALGCALFVNFRPPLFKFASLAVSAYFVYSDVQRLKATGPVAVVPEFSSAA